MADARNAVGLNPESLSAVSSSQNKLVASWVLDYYCFVYWEEFKNKRTVDGLTERNFLTGLLQQEMELTEQRMVIVALIQFIVCLTDGENVNIVYTEGEDSTPLENALKHLNGLADEYDLSGMDVADIENNLKIQAVLACCRADQYILAKSVHQRIWDSETKLWTQEQLSVQRRLQTFVNSQRVSPRFLEQHTYKEFLDGVTVQLQTLWDQFKVPFLLQAVRRIEQRNIQLAEESNSDSSKDSSIELSSSRQDAGNSPCHSSPLKGFRRFRQMSPPSPVLQLNDASDRNNLSGEGSEVDAGKSVAKGNHQATNKRRRHSVKVNPGLFTSTSDEEDGVKGKRRTLSPKNENNSNKDATHRLCTERALEKSLSRLGLTQADWMDIKTKPIEEPSPRASGIITQRVRKRRIYDSPPSSPRPVPNPSLNKSPNEAPTMRRSPRTRTLRSNQHSPQSTSVVAIAESSPPLLTERAPTVAYTTADDTTTSFDNSNDERPNKGTNTPKRGRTIHGLKYQPNRIVDRSNKAPEPTQWSESSDSDSSSSYDYPVLRSLGVRKSLDPSTWKHNGQKLRRPWTNEEVELLKKAVKRYGPGRWSDMLIKYNFKGRTNVNLKDKWRVLVKNGEI